MHLSYTPEQEELRRELRAYFTRLMTPDVRAALTSTDGEYGERQRLPRDRPADGQGRLADAGLAAGVRRPAARPM